MRGIRGQDREPGRADEGFTLIELLVVIIIIGILAAIAIPAYLGERRKAYEDSMKSDLRSVAHEETSYYVDNEIYADNSVITISSPNGLARGSIVIFPGTAIALSAYNVLTIPQAGINGICLKVTNSHTAKPWFYDSFNGGITSVDCSNGSGY